MPKVIDLPTSTSMTASDYLIMEASGGGTKKITKANALSEIGQFVSDASTVNTLPNATYVNLCSVTLTRGKWVLSGQVRLNPSSSGTLDVSLSTTAGDITIGSGGLDQRYITGGVGMQTVGVSSVLDISASSATVYLVARQTTGADVSITASRQFIKAVRVG